MNLKTLKAVKTLDDLNGLGIGDPVVEVSYRGGGVGFRSADVAAYFGVSQDSLPPKRAAWPSTEKKLGLVRGLRAR